MHKNYRLLKGQSSRLLPLDRKFEATLTFTIEPENYTWFLVE